MKQDLEVIVDKGREYKPNIVIEKVTPINEQVGNDFWTTLVEEEVIRYIKNIEVRKSEEAKENIKSIKNNKDIERRTIRTPETEFQNALLRIVYKLDITKKQLANVINTFLSKHKKEESNDLQMEIGKKVGGIESCMEAIESLEKELKSKYEEKDILIATNNEFDARYQIDLLAMIEQNESIKILNLVQVKSNNDDTNQKDITRAHQNYLNSLPQLIGILNVKEAIKSVEEEMNEVVDIDHEKEKEEQLTIFGLVFDQYIKDTKDGKVNAKDLYELLKKEGLKFNPFTIMGILKNEKVLDEYRKHNYFSGDKKIEKYLASTANEIPYTEAESIAFHKKNHVHTILDSAEIFSVVMVGGKKVFEVKLKHPYENIL